MKQEQLEAFLTSVSAVPATAPSDVPSDVTSDNGWFDVPPEQHVTLCVAHNGVGLTVSKVEAIKFDREVVLARTRKGETYQLALDDVFAAAVETPKAGDRKAGFAADR